MRPFCISRKYSQLRSGGRRFTSCRARPRQSADVDNRPVQSSRQPLAAASSEGGLGQSSLKNGVSEDTQGSGPLHGKRAIITGASRGIGAAIARRFAKEGAKCVLVGRDVEALMGVSESLVGPYEADHVVKVGDVGSLEFWKDVARSEKKVDLLVNAAGITHYTALFTTKPELLQEVARTNLMGTILGCRSIGRLMMGKKNTGEGCIINISSLLGLKGGRGSAGYAASKAGVIGLTRALASEVGREGIRVNVIVPGYIESDMTAAMTPQRRSEAVDSIPLGRFGKASEVADAALFLATNKYANNCVLNLDGGLSAM